MKIKDFFEAKEQLMSSLKVKIYEDVEKILNFSITLNEVKSDCIVFSTNFVKATLYLDGILVINYTLEFYKDCIYPIIEIKDLKRHKNFLDGLYENVEEITIKKELIIEKLKELYNKEITIF